MVRMLDLRMVLKMFQYSVLKIVLRQVLLLALKMDWWRVLLLNGKF